MVPVTDAARTVDWYWPSANDGIRPISWLTGLVSAPVKLGVAAVGSWLFVDIATAGAADTGAPVDCPSTRPESDSAPPGVATTDSGAAIDCSTAGPWTPVPRPEHAPGLAPRPQHSESSGKRWSYSARNWPRSIWSITPLLSASR